jgi:hypothetical protein
MTYCRTSIGCLVHFLLRQAVHFLTVTNRLCQFVSLFKAGFFFHDVNRTTLHTVYFIVPLVRPLLKRDILWCAKGIDGGT